METEKIVCSLGCPTTLQDWVDALVDTVRATPVEVRLTPGDLPSKHGLLRRFLGTAAEAEAAGWADGEFGWVCPPCIVQGTSETSGASAKQEGDDLLTQVAVMAALRMVPGRRATDKDADYIWNVRSRIRGLTKLVEAHIAETSASIAA